MATYAHLVRASPADVWSALTDPDQRAGASAWIRRVEAVKGKPGAVDGATRFESRFSKWVEVIRETKKPERLVVEERHPDKDQVLADLEWRLQPVDAGTLVVLEPAGRGFVQAVLTRYVRRRRYRKLVLGVKRAVEGLPESRIEQWPRESTGEGEDADKAIGSRLRALARGRRKGKTEEDSDSAGKEDVAKLEGPAPEDSTERKDAAPKASKPRASTKKAKAKRAPKK